MTIISGRVGEEKPRSKAPILSDRSRHSNRSSDQDQEEHGQQWLDRIRLALEVIPDDGRTQRFPS